jgi:hypothetical protein
MLTHKNKKPPRRGVTKDLSVQQAGHHTTAETTRKTPFVIPDIIETAPYGKERPDIIEIATNLFHQKLPEGLSRIRHREGTAS